MPQIDNLISSLDATSTLRSRVVWLVGMPGSGKTSMLYSVLDKHLNYQYININKLLCGKLLDEAPASRIFVGSTYLSDLLSPITNGAWLVDNIEILFSRELKVPVVDRLKMIAQQAPLIVAWPGRFENDRLIYGDRNHPDYQEYLLDSPVVVDLNNTKNQG